MGWKVKVIRNDTDEVVADYEDCSIVAVLVKGNSIHRIGSLCTTPDGLIATVEALQAILYELEENHHVSDLMRLRRTMKELKALMESYDGDRKTT